MPAITVQDTLVLPRSQHGLIEREVIGRQVARPVLPLVGYVDQERREVVGDRGDRLVVEGQAVVALFQTHVKSRAIVDPQLLAIVAKHHRWKFLAAAGQEQDAVRSGDLDAGG